MTDNDIIKALDEIACNENLKQISGIPHTAKCALDLINRQKAEIEKLQDGCSNCHVVQTKSGIICELREEIERLQKAIAVVDIMEEQHKYALKKAKAEAIKEFAERLKGTKFRHGNDYLIYAENIDYLVKEMTENKNG